MPPGISVSLSVRQSRTVVGVVIVIVIVHEEVQEFTDYDYDNEKSIDDESPAANSLSPPLRDCRDPIGVGVGIDSFLD
jgi:hypothetical protein